MNNKLIRVYSRVIFISFSIGVILFVFFTNLAPFGAQVSLDSSNEKYFSKLSPPTRVETLTDNGETIYKLTDDLVYFTSKLNFKFDKAKIRVTFKNPSDTQEVHLGFKDSDVWHYDTKLIDSPFINNLLMNSMGRNPTLLQKEVKYSSFDEFMRNPPGDKIVGTYNFDNNIFSTKKIPDYRPSQNLTEINTPMRGKVVFYTYVDGELFKLWVQKQDLNMYEDLDVVTIKVYKENDVVYTQTIDDDGIVDASGTPGFIQEGYIQNPGPGLPESGVYKVVVEAGGDTVVKQIKTSMHKIVFGSPIFPVSNYEVYPKIVNETSPNILFSDALVLSALTYHQNAVQEIKVDDKSLKLNEVQKEEATLSTNPLSEITIPKSDVILNGFLGYFAFSKDQYFKPSPLKILPITRKDEAEVSDYIVTNYNPSKQEGDWKVAEADFDLTSAEIKNNSLSWLIKAPGLKEGGRSILIKKIEIELTKEPLIKF